MDCAPAVYEHAALLVGRSPWDVSRDAELTYQAHRLAYLRYRHGPVVVSIDIYNLEAEAYGAVVRRPQGNGVPAIVEPVCRDMEAVAALRHFDPARSGRIPLVIDAAGRLAGELPQADVRVPLAGPVSIASSLLGVETLLCEMLTRPVAARAALEHLAEGQVGFCRAVGEAGLDIAFFESAAAPPLLSPRLFRKVALPVLKRLIERLGAVVGHPVPCVMGGDTEPILDDLLSTGTGYVINPIETDQQAFMRRIWDRGEVRVRINASPSIMARGTRQQLRAEVERIVRLGAGRPNVCLGTSALPYETPPENVEYVQRLCRRLDTS